MAEKEFSRVNSFKVVGKLTDAKVTEGQRKTNGEGYVSVKANIESNVNGQTFNYEIEFYANEKTAKGEVSKLYLNYKDLPNRIGERMEIDGEFRENRFWAESAGQLMSSQKLSGKWVKAVTPTIADGASFEISGFIVKELVEKKNKDNEIYRYDLAIAQANYSGDAISVFTLHVNPSMREIVTGVKGYQAGQTVKITGSLEFVTKKEVKEEASAFGKITREYTNTQKNFYIEAGTNPFTAEEGAYDANSIKEYIAGYKAKDAQLMEEKKNSSESAAVTKETTVTSRQASLL